MKDFYLYDEFSRMFEEKLGGEYDFIEKEDDPIKFHIELLKWADFMEYGIAPNLLGFIKRGGRDA